MAGDVYHLLFDLAVCLHGRIWPVKDRRMVRRLLSLISHVTGKRRDASQFRVLPFWICHARNVVVRKGVCGLLFLWLMVLITVVATWASD